MATEGSTFPGAQVPQAHGPIEACGGKHSTVRRDRSALNGALMAAQYSDGLSGFRTDDPDGAVTVDDHECVAAARKQNLVRGQPADGEDAVAAACSEVPDANGVVADAGTREERLSIRRERE